MGVVGDVTKREEACTKEKMGIGRVRSASKYSMEMP